jgi:thioredoxin-dependent peroxiredoxin
MPSLLLIGLSCLGLLWPGIVQAKPVSVGQTAPDFSLNSHTGKPVTLSQLKGRPVMLVFYPADFTPGCTVQLCSLRDATPQVLAARVQVLAINPANAKSHAQFAQKHHLPFPLLVDTDNTVAKRYGVESHWGFNDRTVFVINPHGIITMAQSGMPTVDDILQAARQGAASTQSKTTVR